MFSAYAVATTPVNILDWASAQAFLSLRNRSPLSQFQPSVMWGGASHPAAQRANALLSECLACATPAVIEGAAHFMISSHEGGVARLIEDYVHSTIRSSVQ